MSDLLAKIQAAVPPGYRAVDVRRPKQGEIYLNRRGKVQTAEFDFKFEVYIILEPDIVWPDWVKSGTWAFRATSGFWCLSKSEPIESDNYWIVDSVATCLYPELLDTSWLPTNIDWKESKRQKP